MRKARKKKAKHPQGRKTAKVTSTAKQLVQTAAPAEGGGDATPSFKAGKDL